MSVMTVSETAELLKTTDGQIYAMLKAGEIPGARIRGRWRLIKDDVISWLQSKYSVKLKEVVCRTAEREQQNGGSLSREYDSLLGRKAKKTPKRLKAD